MIVSCASWSEVLIRSRGRVSTCRSWLPLTVGRRRANSRSAVSRAMDAEHERREQQLREESAPVVRDLARHGFDVELVDDLYAERLDYQSAGVGLQLGQELVHVLGVPFHLRTF